MTSAPALSEQDRADRFDYLMSLLREGGGILSFLDTECRLSPVVGVGVGKGGYAPAGFGVRCDDKSLACDQCWEWWLRKRLHSAEALVGRGYVLYAFRLDEEMDCVTFGRALENLLKAVQRSEEPYQWELSPSRELRVLVPPMERGLYISCWAKRGFERLWTDENPTADMLFAHQTPEPVGKTFHLQPNNCLEVPGVEWHEPRARFGGKRVGLPPEESAPRKRFVLAFPSHPNHGKIMRAWDTLRFDERVDVEIMQDVEGRWREAMTDGSDKDRWRAWLDVIRLLRDRCLLDDAEILHLSDLYNSGSRADRKAGTALREKLLGEGVAIHSDILLNRHEEGFGDKLCEPRTCPFHAAERDSWEGVEGKDVPAETDDSAEPIQFPDTPETAARRKGTAAREKRSRARRKSRAQIVREDRAWQREVAARIERDDATWLIEPAEKPIDIFPENPEDSSDAPSKMDWGDQWDLDTREAVSDLQTVLSALSGVQCDPYGAYSHVAEPPCHQSSSGRSFHVGQGDDGIFAGCWSCRMDEEWRERVESALGIAIKWDFAHLAGYESNNGAGNNEGGPVPVIRLRNPDLQYEDCDGPPTLSALLSMPTWGIGTGKKPATWREREGLVGFRQSTDSGNVDIVRWGGRYVDRNGREIHSKRWTDYRTARKIIGARIQYLRGTKPILFLGGDERSPSPLGRLCVLDIDYKYDPDKGIVESAEKDAARDSFVERLIGLGIPVAPSSSGRGRHAFVRLSQGLSERKARTIELHPEVQVEVFPAGTLKLLAPDILSAFAGDREIPIIDPNEIGIEE